jgi:hypothetical protein
LAHVLLPFLSMLQAKTLVCKRCRSVRSQSKRTLPHRSR